MQTDRGCSGLAFICFENNESVALSMELNNTLILDREMRVERYKENRSKDRKMKIKKPEQNNKNQFANKAGKFKNEKKKKLNKEFSGAKSTDKKNVSCIEQKFDDFNI